MAGIIGSDLLALVNTNLAGYQGAVSTDDVFAHINEGKDEVWMLLKELKEDYFMQSTTSDNTGTPINYFGPMVLGTREYTLPSDLREIRFIEVLTTGYELIKFEHCSVSHPDFYAARRAATQQQTQSPSSASAGGLQLYYYSIVGKDIFMMAQYPEAPFQAKLWYIRSLPDIDYESTLDEILSPFSKKIAEYAAQKIILSLQDAGMFAMWKQQWKESVMAMMSDAGERNSADPHFVTDFEG
jgi:hypothetical protein